MQLNPSLNFNGNCAAAFKFYEKRLGGKIEAMIPHEGTSAAVTKTWRGRLENSAGTAVWALPGMRIPRRAWSAF